MKFRNTLIFRIIRSIYRFVRSIYRYVLYRIIPEKIFIFFRYKRTFGKYIDLKNPKTFNEKMQWIKFYDRAKIYTLIADKYAVRKFISDKIGGEYLIPLLDVQSDPNNILFNKLPVSFVIKPNHSSGQLKIIKNKHVENENDIKVLCKKWLKVNYYSLGKEWQYKNIERKIIIEELLLDEKNNIPMDYKFHCINGSVEFIQVDIDRYSQHKRNFYDEEWNLLPVRLNYENGNTIKKPNKNIKK